MKKLKHFNIGYVWNKKRKKKTIAFNKRNMSLVVDVDSFLCRTRSQRLCIGSFKKSACKHEILDSNTGYDIVFHNDRIVNILVFPQPGYFVVALHSPKSDCFYTKGGTV